MFIFWGVYKQLGTIIVFSNSVHHLFSLLDLLKVSQSHAFIKINVTPGKIFYWVDKNSGRSNMQIISHEKEKKRNCYSCNWHMVSREEWDWSSVEVFRWFAYLFAASPQPREHFIPRQTLTDTGRALVIQGSRWTKETERWLKGVRDNNIMC